MKAENQACSRILVLGAARSGKSRYAQMLANSLWKRPLYVATAEALDDEIADRIEAHRQARGDHWRCIEEPLELAPIIRENPVDADGVLVDCMTIWLSNVLHKDGEGAFEKRKQALLEALRAARQSVIMVSNEVGMGIVPDNELGRIFRDLAGWLNQALAAEADTVVFLVAGLPMVLKGRVPDLERIK